MVKKFSCLTIVLVLFSSLALAFDDKSTHPLLSEKVVEHATYLEKVLKVQLGVEQGVEAMLTNGKHSYTITDWLKRGAEKEDDPDCRARNHFHDPTKPWDEAMLVDSAATFLCLPDLLYPKSYSALIWATDPAVNNKAYPSFYEAQGRNWWVAREFFYRALTESRATDRDRYLAETFKTLGHVLHLLQDMAVPAHTRNDFSQGHMQGIGCPGGGYSWSGCGVLGWIGNPFEGFVRDGLEELLISLESEAEGKEEQLYRPFNGEKILTNFWDTDSVHSPQTGLDIGLAEYSNMNFVSNGSIFREESDPLYYQYPNRDSIAGQEHSEVVDYRLYQVMARDNKLDKGVYVAKNKHGEIIDKFLKPRYVPYMRDDAGHPIVYRLNFTLDDQCYLEYAKRLVPRAIGYSASLLDYFFRGRMEIQRPLVQTGTDSTTAGLIFSIKNNTPSTNEALPVEPFGAGEIDLVYSYMPPSGKDPVFGLRKGIYTVSGPDDPINSGYVRLDVTLPEGVPSGATDLSFLVVFRGELGSEKDAVAAQIIELSRIAFFHQSGGKPNVSNIFTISPSGSDMYQITNATEPNPWYFDPAWSKDGQKLAFTRQMCMQPKSEGCLDENFLEEIIIIDALSDNQFPGNILHELSYNGEPVAGASFSPFGDRIVALMRNRTGYGNYGSLVVFDLEGNTQWVVNTGDNPVGTWFDGSRPVWSPAGDKIVYYLDKQFDGVEIKFEGDLFLINPDGTGKVRLTDDDWTNIDPDWHPNGEFIIFSSNRGRDGLDIWRMDKNGDNLEMVVDCAPANCYQPKFSPDGRNIAFTTNGHIYITNSNGDPTALRMIHDAGLNTSGLSWWSPVPVVSRPQ